MGCIFSRPQTTTLIDPPDLGEKKDSFSDFRATLFSNIGTAKTFKPGHVLIQQDVSTDAAYYIRKGTLKLMKSVDGTSKEIGKRGKGDMLGEMSFLLGDLPGVSVVAEDAVELVEVLHTEIMTMLTDDPKLPGELFKMMASVLSLRIAELSKIMRSEVVSKSSSKPKAKLTQYSVANISKYRMLFQLPKDEQLLVVTNCSMRREMNAVKETNVQFGDLYLFEKHLCLDLKVFGFHKQQVMSFADVVGVLRSNDTANMVEVQGKGFSYELEISEKFDDVCELMEACRRQVKSAEIAESMSQSSLREDDNPVEMVAIKEVDEALQAALESGHDKGAAAKLDLQLTEQDWEVFLKGAKQISYKAGDFVLKEGTPTNALYQILKGQLRVELQVKDSPIAVVVGVRNAGEMFGETSLLNSGPATASIVAEEDSTVIMIDGETLDGMFKISPELPGRFYCFLATYQAQRLRELTRSAGADKAQVKSGVAMPIEDILANDAFTGILQTYLEGSVSEGRAGASEAMNMLQFILEVREFKVNPTSEEMKADVKRLNSSYIDEPREFVTPEMKAAVKKKADAFLSGSIPAQEARNMYADLVLAAVEGIKAKEFGLFLASDFFGQVLELKSKEAFIPSLADFKIMRVLGEGGFGQVLEVVKRDCGKHYAMKVMIKEKMRHCLGSSWMRDITLEKDLMAQLEHPFLVNLKYAFQNPEFLVLVMDIVRSNDLSEFVLTERRLTKEQVRFAVMEVVCVMAYLHSNMILYRDLKPENLLCDEDGHMRLVDMGLAARISKQRPKRRSRVGTDCYMAPEVRWAKQRQEPYGPSCDWYTVGVLLYEFSAGNIPYPHPNHQNPKYRPHDFKNPQAEDLCRRLLDQKHSTRIGCGAAGISEILDHDYWQGVEWDLVPSKKLRSPLKGLRNQPRRRKDREEQAIRTATDMAQAERDTDGVDHHNVGSWDFVAPIAITEEYIEQMYSAVSNI